MPDRWGPDGPPPEAYSRVTNPERFAPVVEAADVLVATLLRDYDVDARPVDVVSDIVRMVVARRGRLREADPGGVTGKICMAGVAASGAGFRQRDRVGSRCERPAGHGHRDRVRHRGARPVECQPHARVEP